MLLIPYLAVGQTKVSGTVTDSSGIPIPGANVYIVGTYDGTSSATDGGFEFMTFAEEELVLAVSFVGYAAYAIPLEASTTDIGVILHEETSQMNAVVITAGMLDASDEVKGQVLRPLDIVTTAGATADIAGALNTMPGTQTVGEQGRLFVRGGDAYETTTFIDGILVTDSYNSNVPNVPTRSRFSPMMFKGTSFSTGGYSAEYGQGLSSALILKSKDVATQNRSDISIMSVGLEAAHTQTFNGSSLSAKVGYISLAPYFALVPQSINWEIAPVTFDGNVSYRKSLKKNGSFKVYGKFSGSDMKMDWYPVDSSFVMDYRVKNTYQYIGASFDQLLSDRWTIFAGAGFTSSKDEISPGNSHVEDEKRSFHSKLGFGTDITRDIYVKFGAETFQLHNAERFEADSGFVNTFEVAPTIHVGYSEFEVYLSKQLLIRAGARWEHSAGTSTLDPRISLAQKLGGGQLSLAYGNFRQAAPFQYARINNGLHAEKATHYIASYQLVKGNRIFRVEGYHKSYDKLVTFNSGNPWVSENYSNSGNGYARGLDLFWRDGESISNADYWISYSYLDTERKYKDYPYSATPGFASAHNISVVYKHFVSAWKTQFGGTYTYGSGRPYSDPATGGFNNLRTPDYHDLSINISYLVRDNMILHGSVTNVLGRENVFGYEYSPNPDDAGMYSRRPVMLPAKRFLFIGFFITLSKENTMNQLPNL